MHPQIFVFVFLFSIDIIHVVMLFKWEIAISPTPPPHPILLVHRPTLTGATNVTLFLLDLHDYYA